MEQKPCVKCGMMIAKRAVICPHCHTEQKNKKVKWIAIGAVALFLLLGMCSVQNNQDTDTATDTADSGAPTAVSDSAATASETVDNITADNNATAPDNTATQLEQNTNTEADFKAACQYLNYEDILRNSSNYKSVNCKIDGEVSQIIEGLFGSYSIFVADADGNKWGCTYSYKDGESKLLEGDKVTVYGTCKGTTNTKTVLGKQVTMPYVDLEYIR